MLKKILPILLTAALLVGCTPTPTASVFLKEVPLRTEMRAVTVDDALRNSLYDLTSELAPDYFRESEKQNQIFSPLSLWVALGVLREGATAETRREIEAIMKIPAEFDSGKTIPDLSAALNFMVDSVLAKGKEKNGILLTNGIFFDGRYADDILPAFWDKAASIWGTETAQVDFTKEAVTREIIRQWVSDNTQTFLDDYEATFATDGTAILNIYNVLYLKDLWTRPFTRLDGQIFHAPTGDVTVPFISQLSNEVLYADHPQARAAAFSGETGIRVWFVLPRGQAEPQSLIPDLAQILKGSAKAIRFQAPVLAIDGENLSLMELLKRKGYTRMFNDAQLDGMLTTKGAAVTEIKQKTKLELDEKGFKAAAVTEIGIGKTATPVDDPVDFIVDQPYLLVIEYQGLPLFVANVQDPSER